MKKEGVINDVGTAASVDNAKTTIAIEKIENDDVEKAVFSALDSINASSHFWEGMTVLLKPNLLIAKPPERAATTHPEVVRAVIRYVKRFAPSKIYVCDSSGGIKRGTTENAIKVSGIGKVCEEEGAECIPFEKTEVKEYKVENPLVLDRIISSSLLEKVDIIINLPKIKTHGQCTLTCCIKNMFGTLILTHKPKTHAEFSTLDKFTKALVDIYSVSRPQITVIDGYYGMEGNGPSQGDPVKMDIIIAGYDPVALDTAVCKIIGLDPQEVRYIKWAEMKGLGTSDLGKVEFIGNKPEEVARKFKRPKLNPVSLPVPGKIGRYIGRTLFRARIKFDREKCKLCGTCWKNCPVGALSPPSNPEIGKNVPVWDSKKCITCYCCAELCPYEAVDFEVPLVKNALFSWIGLSLLVALGLIGWGIYLIIKLLFFGGL